MIGNGRARCYDKNWKNSVLLLSDIITHCKVHLIATNIETAEETSFNVYEFPMYPKSTRKVELYLKEKLPKGTYSLAAILDYGSKTNLEGTQMIIKVE